ncbi:MAG: tetratricopeptide repeat protein [Treponema sp.]|nr:tetratricopeptide repeat protein [Treponema sp.]
MKSKDIRVLLILTVLLLLLSSCKTTQSKRAMNNPGIIYAMVYDGNYKPISGVSVLINDKKITESDIQGRVVFDMNKTADYTITLEKKGYESITETIKYDPLNALYFKMIDTVELTNLADNAIEQKNYIAAHEYLDRALALDPSLPDALFLKSIVFYLQNKNNEAMLILENLMSLGLKDEYIIDFYRRMSE